MGEALIDHTTSTLTTISSLNGGGVVDFLTLDMEANPALRAAYAAARHETAQEQAELALSMGITKDGLRGNVW